MSNLLTGLDLELLQNYKNPGEMANFTAYKPDFSRTKTKKKNGTKLYLIFKTTKINQKNCLDIFSEKQKKKKKHQTTEKYEISATPFENSAI